MCIRDRDDVVDALRPRVGVHYPASVGEMRSWFATDEDCLDYLDWLRWPQGFVCPRCGNAGGWLVADGRYKCAGCGKRTSVTAGTLFDRRRTPLTVWFEACWLFASGKDGMSALSLQRSLEIGSPARWRSTRPTSGARNLGCAAGAPRAKRSW